MSRIVYVIALSILFVLPNAAPSLGASLFGTIEIRNGSLNALPQWQAVMARLEAERAGYRACDNDPSRCANATIREWRALIRRLRGQPQDEIVRRVNHFVNGVRYTADDANYGRSDYWATPLEFFRHTGDCEDYAIVKYATLRELGFSPAQLRMVVVQDVPRDLPHAVLAVTLQGRTVILDNAEEKVRPIERVTRYAPYYSVNETARWSHIYPGGRQLAGFEGRLHVASRASAPER